MPKNSSKANANVAAASLGVSAARLHQKSGSSNAFGGYTKVHQPDGTFRMRRAGK